MPNAEFMKWIRWELGLAGAALLGGFVAWLAAGADPRWMAASLGIVIAGEVMRDSLIIARADQRRRERDGGD